MPTYPDPNSIVDYLKSHGEDSSLEARKKLASGLGYMGPTSEDNYAAMNRWLLEELRDRPFRPTGLLNWIKRLLRAIFGG